MIVINDCTFSHMGAHFEPMCVHGRNGKMAAQLFLAMLKVIGLAQSHRFIFYCLGNMEMDHTHTHSPTTNSDSPSALPFPCLFTRRLHNSLLCHTRISITCFMMQSQ